MESTRNTDPTIVDRKLTNIFDNIEPRKSWGAGIEDKLVLEWLIANLSIVMDKQRNLSENFKTMFAEIVNDYIRIYEDKLLKLRELQTILSPPVWIRELIYSRNRKDDYTYNPKGGSMRFNLHNKTKRSSNSKKYKRIRNKSKRTKHLQFKHNVLNSSIL